MRCALRRLVLAGLLATGCNEYVEPGEPTGATCDPRLSYATDVQPIMTKYCVRCHASTLPYEKRHGAPADHNFDTQEGVYENADHIALRAGSGVLATNRSMPPPGYAEPTDAERKILGRFMACVLASDGGVIGPHTH